MTHLDLRKKFFEFWEEKPRNHALIPGGSLVPENDPTVLFTTAGMHPLVPYLLGQPHPEGKRLVDVQKCVRTNDIDEVGDTIHHTFFEMLGNWSLGDYFKQEAINWSYEFLIDRLKLDPKRLYVAVFAGDEDAPRDDFSADVWQKAGILDERIFFFPKKDNWWGPAGETGPCGPDTEMHYDVTEKPCGPDCKPGCSCGRFSEIWNNVFMEYNKKSDGKFEKLAQQNVDTGMGLDRTLAVVNGLNDDYLTDLWQPAIKKIGELSGKKYEENLRQFRIITDHIRATLFIAYDGVMPSNKERGYVLRRLIRRTVMQSKILGFNDLNTGMLDVLDVFIVTMKIVYPELAASRERIRDVISAEINKFTKTLENGLKEFNRLDAIDGKAAFDLFQTFGYPWELTAEMARDKGLDVSKLEFQKEFEKHRKLSRTASAGMFAGGLVDHSEIVTKYHTATHLLQAALRKVLGEHVHQEGSNLTAERLRFDFSFTRKLTEEEKLKVAEIINEQIKNGLERKVETMTYDAAIKSGALAFFKERYPDKVTVYSFMDPSINSGPPFSREICGGPHVENTGTLGKFKIIKEEAVASGIRRIYAVLS